MGTTPTIGTLQWTNGVRRYIQSGIPFYNSPTNLGAFSSLIGGDIPPPRLDYTSDGNWKFADGNPVPTTIGLPLTLI